MLRLLAKIYLFDESENGQARDGWSGMRPSFGFHDEIITSEICSLDKHELVFMRGSWTEAEVRLPYGEVFAGEICKGMRFCINIGGWQIGEGVVQEILECIDEPRHADIREAVRKARSIEKKSLPKRGSS